MSHPYVLHWKTNLTSYVCQLSWKIIEENPFLSLAGPPRPPCLQLWPTCTDFCPSNQDHLQPSDCPSHCLPLAQIPTGATSLLCCWDLTPQDWGTSVLSGNFLILLPRRNLSFPSMPSALSPRPLSPCYSYIHRIDMLVLVYGLIMMLHFIVRRLTTAQNTWCWAFYLLKKCLFNWKHSWDIRH